MMLPIKSCALDPVPTFLLPEFVDCMVNSSLHDARVPDSQKQAVITPLLKQPGLDIMDMANYRQLSNVMFMSKVIKRAVAK